MIVEERPNVHPRGLVFLFTNNAYLKARLWGVIVVFMSLIFLKLSLLHLSKRMYSYICVCVCVCVCAPKYTIFNT